MLLSIIIPVYNVERYVRRCLESVFDSGAAGNAEVEVIVVDDGTPDGSMAIVEEIAAKQSNLTIIRQTNQGLSAARNAGLAIAKGKYVWFIDSDDYVTPTAVTEIVEIARTHGEDLIEFDTTSIYEDNSKEPRIQHLFTFKGDHRYYGSVHDGYFFHGKFVGGLVQRDLFLRSFLIENDLTFIRGILHEDIEYMTHVMVCARTVLPMRRVYYNYIVRENGSITTTFNPKRQENILFMIRLCVERGDAAKDRRVKTIYHDAACRRAYKMMHPKEGYWPAEYWTFVGEHKKELSRIVVRSFFRSLRKADWRSALYMLLTALHISDGIDLVYHRMKSKVVEE